MADGKAALRGPEFPPVCASCTLRWGPSGSLVEGNTPQRVPLDPVKSASPGESVKQAGSPTHWPDSARMGDRECSVLPGFLGDPVPLMAEKLCPTLGLLGKQEQNSGELWESPGPSPAGGHSEDS